MITPLRVVFDVIVRMGQLIELVNCLIAFETCLLHQVEIVNVDDRL